MIINIASSLSSEAQPQFSLEWRSSYSATHAFFSSSAVPKRPLSVLTSSVRLSHWSQSPAPTLPQKNRSLWQKRPHHLRQLQTTLFTPSSPMMSICHDFWWKVQSILASILPLNLMNYATFQDGQSAKFDFQLEVDDLKLQRLHMKNPYRFSSQYGVAAGSFNFKLEVEKIELCCSKL